MAQTDTYLISRIHDELVTQNKKLDKIVKQLEAQTILQEGIFKQLYLLCQIASTPSDILKDSYRRDSVDVFEETQVTGYTHDEKPMEENDE